MTETAETLWQLIAEETHDWWMGKARAGEISLVEACEERDESARQQWLAYQKMGIEGFVTPKEAARKIEEYVNTH